MRGVAHAIHSAARELEESLPEAAGYVHSAATKLDDGAAAMRTRGVDDLFKSFNDLARREPGLVLAGAAIAGLAVSRFLKASSRG